MQTSNVKFELKRLSETRRSCQHASCSAVQQTLPAMLSTLKHVSLVDNSSVERSLGATARLNFVNGEFVVQLVTFERLLSKVNIVSKQQQSATCELSPAIDLVDCLQLSIWWTVSSYRFGGLSQAIDLVDCLQLSIWCTVSSTT